MERYTWREHGKPRLRMGDTEYIGGSIIEKFTAYEDSGLTPAQVTEYSKAKAEDTLKMQKYRHYKGGIYIVIGIARHSETLIDLVIYLDEKGFAWARPKEMFFGTVEINGEKIKRFTPVKIRDGEAI